MPDPRFDYRKYRTASISVERLDAIADIILNAGTGKVAALIGAVKMTLIVGYLIARKIMIDQELLIAKNQYEQETGNEDRDEVDDEDLDG